MVVTDGIRSRGKRLGTLILSRLAELWQEVVHDKDALHGDIPLE